MKPEIWIDGRSGEAGIRAGNLVIADLQKRIGERIRRVKGTWFCSSKYLFVARFASGGTGSRAHWANVSPRQFAEVQAEAHKKKLSPEFVFITAGTDKVDYWRLSASIVGDAMAQLPTKKSDNSVLLEIRQDGRRYHLLNKDITRYHVSFVPNNRDRTSLAQLLSRSRPPNSEPGSNSSDLGAVPRTGLQLQRVFSHDEELALVLPRELAKAANISAGSFVSVCEADGIINLRCVEVVPKLSPTTQGFVDELYARRRRVFEALGE